MIENSTGDSAQSSLSPDCTTGWLAPEERTGEDAQLTIDLGCTTLLDNVRMKNLAQDRGIDQFTIQSSNEPTGPWTEIVTARMEPFKERPIIFKPSIKLKVMLFQDCDQPSTEFMLLNIQRQQRTGRYVRILVKTYFGAGGGLSHVSFNGKKAANSKYIACINDTLIHPYVRS